MEWKAAAEKCSGYKLKILRTNNGSEFYFTVFENYLKSEGVKHELTVLKTPKQNGVAKRLNRTLVEAVRAMLIQAKLPQRFWVEALSNAVYLHNRSPTKRVADMTPLQAWAGVKPNVKHLRSFGCIVYAHIPKDERRKLDLKSKKCVLFGYGTCTILKVHELCTAVTSNLMKMNLALKTPCQCQVMKFMVINLLLYNFQVKKYDNEDDQVDNIELNVHPPVRTRHAPDRFGEWVTGQ